jgi:hypothetical protein
MQNPIPIAILVAITMGGFLLATPATSQPSTPTAMSNPLEVRLTQKGIAGETGTQWIVSPDGQWTAQRIQSGVAPETFAKGILSQENLATLRSALDRNQIDDLPPKLGKLMANPQTLTVRFGNKAAVLSAPGATDMKATSGSGADIPENRLKDIANTVRSLTVEQ